MQEETGKFKNYVRARIIDEYYQERIDDYEVKFDKYKRMNIFIGGHNYSSFCSRWFDYKGRSIARMFESIKKYMVVPKDGKQWTRDNITYYNFILEIEKIEIPDNPSENKIFEKYPELDLGLTEEHIIFVLPQIKEYIKANLEEAKPGAEIHIEERFYGGGDSMRPYCLVDMIYGYNRYGKVKCKIKLFGTNPGGRFYFAVNRWCFKDLQDLIKEYVEND